MKKQDIIMFNCGEYIKDFDYQANYLQSIDSCRIQPNLQLYNDKSQTEDDIKLCFDSFFKLFIDTAPLNYTDPAARQHSNKISYNQFDLYCGYINKSYDCQCSSAMPMKGSCKLLYDQIYDALKKYPRNISEDILLTILPSIDFADYTYDQYIQKIICLLQNLYIKTQYLCKEIGALHSHPDDCKNNCKKLHKYFYRLCIMLYTILNKYHASSDITYTDKLLFNTNYKDL